MSICQNVPGLCLDGENLSERGLPKGGEGKEGVDDVVGFGSVDF